MHVPDGFLSGKTLVASGAVAAGGVAVALRQVRRLPPRIIPLMGVSAAFVFAAQMLNFPVAGGTSGHLIGGVLAAVLLGPSAAVLALTAVLLVQCFLFADGGVLALGANVLNMGIVDALVGYYVYRAVRRAIGGTQGLLVGVAFASWCGVVVAAAVCAGQLAVSGTVPGRVVFPAMVHVHMLIGLGEALITTLIVLAVQKARPELLEDQPAAATSLPVRRGTWEFAAYGLLIAAALALFVSPLASKWPDGLDRCAEVLGFKERATDGFKAPLPDYQVPHVGHVGLSTAIAGLIGTAVVFGLALLLARVLMRPATAAPHPPEAET